MNDRYNVRSCSLTSITIYNIQCLLIIHLFGVISYIFIIHKIFNNNMRMVSSNLSFIFHHSWSSFFDIFVSVETPQSGVRGVKHVRSICVLHRRPEGADTHPHRQQQLAVMCTVISWTSTDMSTSSNASFIIVKFKNTAFSEIIMNERKNVDDKRNCLYIYRSFDSCLYICLSHTHTRTSSPYLSIIIIMRILRPKIFYSKRPCPCEVFKNVLYA